MGTQAFFFSEINCGLTIGLKTGGLHFKKVSAFEKIINR
jgi:hypothetical protein